MSELTVFVVGDDQDGTALRETVALWADEGLVVPSLWVTPASVEVESAGPPRVDAELVACGTRETDDLFRFVGRRRLSTVRVVVAQSVTLGAAHDTALLDAAERVADSLRDALPRSTEEDGHSTTLLRINLLAPVSGASGLSKEAIVEGWDVNVVVSAEDRPDVDRSTVFVRSPGNSVGHTATAMVVCGGVLAGVDAGVFEVLAPPQSTVNGREVEVVRVHVRAVIGEDLEARLLARALEEVDGEASGAGAFVEWARLAVDPDRIVEDLTRHLVGTSPWRSDGPVQVERADRRESGFLRGVLDAARFNATTFATVPRWVLGRRIARLEESATNVVVGGGGDTVIRLRPGRPETVSGAAADYLRSVDEQARRDELEREASAVAVPDPRSWGELRAVAFAAVDGGELPQAVPTPRYAGTREILPADRVVPDPTNTYEYGGETIAPTDPTVTRRVERRLDDRVQGWQTALEDSEREVERAQAALDELLTPAPPEEASAGGTPADGSPSDADTEDAPGGTTEDGGDGKGRKSADRRRAPKARRDRTAALAAAEAEHGAATSTRDDVRASYDAALAEREEFRTWQGAASASVLWRLLDDVSGRLEQFRRLRDESRERLTVEVPPHEALEAAQKRLVRRWRVLLTAGFVALGVVLAWLRYDGQPEEVVDWIVGVGGVVAVSLALIAVANHRFYRATRAYAWDVQRVADRRRQASEDVVYYGRESARLGQLYETLVDWATIVGWVLHHPRGSVAPSSSRLDDRVVETFPAAFAVARTAEDDDIGRATVVSAVRRLHPVGWAGQCFDDAYEAHRTQQARDDDAGFIAPDLDTVSSAHGPRRLFTEFWESGRAAEALTQRAVAQLREAVHDELITLPTRRVGRLGPHGDGEHVLEPDFYRAAAGTSTMLVADMFGPVAKQERKHYVTRSAVWLPTMAAGTVTADDIVERRSTADVAVRVDVSRRLAGDDLTLFHTSPEPPVEAPSETADRRPTGAATEPTFH
ncbi:hypothetical protein [Isoptericola sp. b408]|uniref:hypothetical protein n=1 Tax=Isoptericola sp. b408 TaxID=3064653 RepID=UPI002712784E|nr:hypothetical protein [Isoptericola sp. b408]MDO8150181.1 hypothetical protein [Isoptericola sp. b408]